MNSIRQITITALLFLILVFTNGSGNYYAGLQSGAATVFQEKGEKVLVIHAPIRDLTEFRELARQAARLKPFGRVEVNISTLADKGFYEIPAGNNFWYEYASYNPTPYKFFPDHQITPFIPAEFVRKNRELLLAKAKILREFGLEAAFWCYEPNFIPEAFFEAYPQLRGPRVDHPRRGNQPAFAPCIDLKETQEMYSNMVAELLKNVPGIHTFFFKTNDSGSGICWSDWQYTGPNGPTQCKNNSMGERVASLMNSFKSGAAKAGKEISIYLTGSMFSDEEKKDIYQHLPEYCYFQSNTDDIDVYEVQAIGSEIIANYPVRGLFDPIEILRSINALGKSEANTVFISFRSLYDRGYDLPSVVDKLTSMLVKYMNTPVPEGQIAELQQLRLLCAEWAGEHAADRLYDAFMALEEANNYKSTAAGGVSGIYWGVSARHITRPLVIAPQLLTKDEEAYFLPHVFNASETEGRMDYTDIHGAHRTVEAGAISKYVSMVNKAIMLMERLPETAPENNFIRNMAKALRIHCSIMRSCGNFGEAQAIRDRNAEKLSNPPHRPDKAPTWEGDPDLQVFNTIMRDELDNTQQLITLLQDGGMDLICHATDPRYEDTFLLGPDLIEQLKLKRKIMLNHWTDIEGYMTTPFK
ncbi:MAG: hypothetical protein A2X05_14485 [Bacteroidetes bacterium GWE2_41_25]|nr:MAG: hypothetical protein A2X03_06575 [Bacteroidetes bacterium GWA2_40_15]OFX88320.1 MAG: hypothetical protein A2X06_04820 [Bacteroidetes bacterium GWC2_40_22]OFY06333.1 MAG: hypothetical protein A2X05_14485 [Bacteroidetes bacterium GWE2_41_25]HBH85761.1 hypothetical protein [Bacteroidales bacterium]HCU20445.1 hypothetical protein [Bacteroidales bacterium]